jgi:methylated-DNA-protein-cysteine methyltransferase-like protein
MTNSSLEFHDAVLYILGQIPKGKVTSYGKIAKLAGYPNHSRHVGKILAQLPKDTELPWFRVMNSQGKISLPDNSERYKYQQQLLQAEGVQFLNSKVNFKQFGWPDY